MKKKKYTKKKEKYIKRNKKVKKSRKRWSKFVFQVSECLERWSVVWEQKKIGRIVCK